MSCARSRDPSRIARAAHPPAGCARRCSPPWSVRRIAAGRCRHPDSRAASALASARHSYIEPTTRGGMSRAALIEHLIESRERLLGVRRIPGRCAPAAPGSPSIESGEFALLNRRCAFAHSLRARRELAELDMRLANPLVRERDPLPIAERDAEVAGLGELHDRGGVVAHQLEDLSTHESRNRKPHGGIVGRVPVDLLLIERERLAVVAHAAHDQRQRSPPP